MSKENEVKALALYLGIDASEISPVEYKHYMSKGIDYGCGITNLNLNTGIRYGVISMHDIGQAWHDSSEAIYPTPRECNADCDCEKCGMSIEIPESANWGDTLDCETEGSCGGTGTIDEGDFVEPSSFELLDCDYHATQSHDDCDIFILSSKYFAYAPFCSPCAPGACYLSGSNISECDENSGEKTYCFGHDMFWDTEEKRAPYKVYSVETGIEVKPE